MAPERRALSLKDDTEEFKKGKKEMRQPGNRPVDEAALKKYKRGVGNKFSTIKGKRTKKVISRAEREVSAAQARAAAAELLLPDDVGYLEAEGMESTEKFKQRDLISAVDLNTAKSIFELPLLELGPYVLDYSRNGRWLILGGRKGHLALIDTLRMEVQMEVQLREEIRDVCSLHNQNFVAVAQRKYVYIYDDHGAEVHCLRQHTEPYRLQFLRHHFLLASIGNSAKLRYHDITTGELVAELDTHKGPCSVLHQNTQNGIMHCGHSRGVVTLWSPTVGKCLISMLTHRGPVTSLVIDSTGNHMVTAGQDRKVRVWDLRTYKELHSYVPPSAISTMSISQRGLLALGYGPHVSIWKDAISSKAKKPYLKHTFNTGTRVQKICFRPYEDSLGVGHKQGYSTLLIPGAGEPNFDTFSENPFETLKQRREGEVKSLLDKLQPETISLNPNFIGTIDNDPDMLRKELQELQNMADTTVKRPKKVKNKMRGKNKISKKMAKKQANVIDTGMMKLREKLAAEKEASLKVKEEKKKAELAENAPSALAKFYK